MGKMRKICILAMLVGLFVAAIALVDFGIWNTKIHLAWMFFWISMFHINGKKMKIRREKG